MARQTQLKSWDSLTAFKADTVIEQQIGDQVKVEGVLSEGTTHLCRAAGAETPDDVYIIEKTNDASKRFWAENVSSLVGSAVNVTFNGLPEGTEEPYQVTVAACEIGKAYAVGVVSGLPSNANGEAEISVQPVETDGTLPIIIENNTGLDLASGTIVINVYELK